MSFWRLITCPSSAILLSCSARSATDVGQHTCTYTRIYHSLVPFVSHAPLVRLSIISSISCVSRPRVWSVSTAFLERSIVSKRERESERATSIERTKQQERRPFASCSSSSSCSTGRGGFVGCSPTPGVDESRSASYITIHETNASKQASYYNTRHASSSAACATTYRPEAAGFRAARSRSSSSIEICVENCWSLRRSLATMAVVSWRLFCACCFS